MRINLVGGSDPAQSLNVSVARSVNWYVETASSQAKAPYYLLPTPGLTRFVDLGGAVVRGLWVMGAYLYAVADDGLFRVDSGGTSTRLGTLKTATGRVGMADNGSQLMIVDGPNGYVWDGTTLSTPSNFPGATHVGYLDGYFVLCGHDGKFWITSLYNGKAIDPLDFASAEGDPDPLTALIVDHRELLLFGPASAEPWSNTGAADFPIERISGGFMEMGVAAPYSVAKMDNSVFFLAQSKTEGFKGLARLNSYTPVIVSTPGITAKMAKYTWADAFAFTYTQGLHSFYVITFPTDGVTWVYDASLPPELAWHEWQSFHLGRHRANCHAVFNGRHVLGDSLSGKLYWLDADAYTDDGTTIRRERSRSFAGIEGKRLFVREVQALFEAGVGTASLDPQAMLQISRDGGHTWGNERWRGLGKVGEYRRRARWLACGQGRDLAIKIAVTDPVRTVLIDGYATVDAGSA